MVHCVLSAVPADYVQIHCNFICGSSDVIIKTFSQSVSQSQTGYINV